MEQRNYTEELLRAIDFEEPELVRLCIENGANVNFDLGDGWTILHETFDYTFDSMHQNCKTTPTPEMIRIIELLVKHGGDLLKKNSSNKTPLDSLSTYTASIEGFNRNKDFFRAIVPNIDELVEYADPPKYWRYKK